MSGAVIDNRLREPGVVVEMTPLSASAEQLSHYIWALLWRTAPPLCLRISRSILYSTFEHCSGVQHLRSAQHFKEHALNFLTPAMIQRWPLWSSCWDDASERICRAAISLHLSIALAYSTSALLAHIKEHALLYIWVLLWRTAPPLCLRISRSMLYSTFEHCSGVQHLRSAQHFKEHALNFLTPAMIQRWWPLWSSC
jgi:hypothetical protein